ncbi:MAG: thiopeptide-type bacteriocin biosynthesis protein [Bacteroidales bacterium]
MDLKRQYIPGENWLYFKVYCGPKFSDRILACDILPFSVKLINENVIDKWFFIRYFDTDYHLRLRFHIINSNNLMYVISEFNKLIKEYIKVKFIWNISIETYNRELERYGENAMEAAESVFFYDSQFISQLYPFFKGIDGEELRWLIALRSINDILDLFYYTINDKYNLMLQMKNAFEHEFNVGHDLEIHIQRKYRLSKDKIDFFLTSISINIQLIDNIFFEKNRNLKKEVDYLISLQKKLGLSVTLNDYLWSIIHMMNNRVFRTQQRIHELIIYSFLLFFYKSLLAKTNNNEQK